MPRGDRSGPDGYGPRTGRGLGYCNGYDTPGFSRGSGRGFGRGRGFGFRRDFAYSRKNQKQLMEEELADLEAEKKFIEEEIKAIKAELEAFK